MFLTQQNNLCESDQHSNSFVAHCILPALVTIFRTSSHHLMTISLTLLFKQPSRVLRRCKLILFTINNPFDLNISHPLSILHTTQIIMMIYSLPLLCPAVSMAVIVQGNLFLKQKRMLIGKKSSNIHLSTSPLVTTLPSTLLFS